MSFWRANNVVTRTLKYYDYLVNEINCKYVWRCEPQNIINMYRQHCSSSHLEIGPGTGHFLLMSGKKQFNSLGIMDINKKILNYSANQLGSQYNNISIYHQNIFMSDNFDQIKPSSVGVNYVLHCVPGNLENKMEKLINNLSNNEKTTIFGATVINDSERQTVSSKLLLKFLNKKGVFHNKEDYSYHLKDYLVKNNIRHELQIIGNVLLFNVKI